MLQAKQEIREEESPLAARKPRNEQDMQEQHQMGNYLLQSSTGAMPASQASIPANFWMGSGDPIWTFQNVSNSGGLYRGSMSSGLHFMNFPTPMALLPNQQLGTNIGVGAGAGAGINLGEAQLGMITGLNQYRSGGSVSESPASGSHPQHHADDRHDTTSHHS